MVCIHLSMDIICEGSDNKTTVYAQDRYGETEYRSH